jgi:phage N-6-adenine-methyltransferase
LKQNHLYLPLGDRLRARRRELKKTQADVAAALSLSLPTVRQAESGQGYLSIFLVIMSFLDLDIAGSSLPQGDHLGARLGKLRARKKLSLRSLSEVADISPTTIGALERGANVQTSVALKVGQTLGAGLFLWPKGQPTPFFSAAGNSSGYDAWTTPPWVLEKLYEVIGGLFDLDPCAPTRTGQDGVRAKVRFTEEDNGLALPWFGKVFLNPPYSRTMIRWIAKAHAEVVSGRAQMVVCLVPVRTDTAWFHRHVVGHADFWLLKGRLSFGDGTQAAPFPSTLIIWNASAEVRAAMNSAFAAAHVPSSPHAKGMLEEPGNALALT